LSATTAAGTDIPQPPPVHNHISYTDRCKQLTDIILQETENFFVFYIISMTTISFLVVLDSDVKTGFFPKRETGLQKPLILPVIERLLSTDYRGIRKGANFSAELEYSLFSKLTYQIYSRS